MKQEQWNGNTIRFVDVNGEWWAVAKDVADALGYVKTSNMVKHVPEKYFIRSVLEHMNAKSLLLSEFGIYKAVFNSHKPEAQEFQEWVFKVIKTLRQSTSLEGFETFRMFDKEHQKQAKAELNQGLNERATTADYIKANTIANKAVSNQYGHPKMIKKSEMTPEMLKAREPILKDIVGLMEVKEKFDLPIPVSETVYKKVGEP
ncbi:Bro-N domain-containing protein [Pediococcus acidilactici]|uniref:BRO-N domain-containing protein n=1 Tax=Pediococcus acidilactici TaxID=1254 RepID=UPI001320D976|nr:BRO family protein [Pediococcus acidilactici]KAF0334486.1 phage repressor protein [Pediococcus acidilactici]KAF0393891.1 phage repressor protein [Pediococcus acidilactici]KAF0398114.1 phage repressor protein [Pediococcus acidilactici]KAF0410270.1 phage repressor protein [Pediococcus acidilactici]KAF0435617.1 phage repressor protein [Pediococcus acidilactici]